MGTTTPAILAIMSALDPANGGPGDPWAAVAALLSPRPAATAQPAIQLASNRHQLAPPQIQDTGSTGEKIDPSDQPRRRGPTAPTCAAINRRGNPCQALPRTGQPLCGAHDPANAAAFRAQARLGGRRSAARRAERDAPSEIDFDYVSIHDRDSLQYLIDAVFRLELTGRLSAERTRNLVRLLNVAARNILAARGTPIRSPGAAFTSDYNKDILRGIPPLARDSDA